MNEFIVILLIFIVVIIIITLASGVKPDPVYVGAEQIKHGDTVYVRMCEAKPNDDGGYWYEMVWRKGVVTNVVFQNDRNFFRVSVEGWNEPVFLEAKDLFVRK